MEWTTRNIIMVVTLVLTATLAPIGWLIQKYWIHGKGMYSIPVVALAHRDGIFRMVDTNADRVYLKITYMTTILQDGGRTRWTWSMAWKWFRDAAQPTAEGGHWRHGAASPEPLQSIPGTAPRS